MFDCAAPARGALSSPETDDVSKSLRIALLLDPLSMVLDEPLRLRMKWRDHAPMLARELLGSGHTVRGFGAPPGLVPRSGEDSPPGAEGAWTKLAAFQPDVLLAYDALSPAAVRACRMARRSGASVVLVESGLPGIGRRVQRLRQRVGEILWGPYVRRRSDGLVALDVVARDQMLREGFDPSLVRVVPHGVDVVDFRPGLISPLIGNYRIRGRILLYVGRLEQSRGVDLALGAFARTVGQRGDWSLVLAGEGPAKPELRAMADRLGISTRVHWLPRPRKEELPGLMGAATALVVPARADVLMGRHVGRALACGLPVLGSDLPRLKHLLEGEQRGLLVPVGSLEGWVEAIRRAAGSPAARQRWSRDARAFAERELAWPVIASRIEEVLALASEHASRRNARKSSRVPAA